MKMVVILGFRYSIGSTSKYDDDDDDDDSRTMGG